MLCLRGLFVIEDAVEQATVGADQIAADEIDTPVEVAALAEDLTKELPLAAVFVFEGPGLMALA